MPLRIKLQAGDVDVDQAKLETYLKDPEGPIAKDLKRRGDAVSAAMKVPVDTGLLASTKRVEMDYTDRLPAVDIIVGRSGATDYLGYVIGGTRPHEIRPRTAKALRFVSGGQVVFSAKVDHPGTRANSFMTDALGAAAD